MQLEDSLSQLTQLSFLGALFTINLMAFTPFLTNLIAFSLVKLGVGTPSVPPSIAIVALALALSVGSLFDQGLFPCFDQACGSLADNMISALAANEGVAPAAFSGIRATLDGLFTAVIGKIVEGLQLGLRLIIPLVIIDLVTGSVLMGLGMLMLPPTVVSLPLKIAFVLESDLLQEVFQRA
ncbi:MAG: hypothetical protein ACFB3T_13445 [Geminicoccaceae bacterium]